MNITVQYTQSSIPGRFNSCRGTMGVCTPRDEEYVSSCSCNSHGASVIRVGFEDSVYYAPGKIGKTNAVLVEKAATLIRDMGFEVATTSESRELLGIRSRL